MRTKTIIILILLALLVQIAPAGPANASGEEIVRQQVRLAKWDIWLHADGRTWQDTGAPGDRRSYTFDVTPPQIAGVRITRFEMTAGVSRGQFMAGGGWGGYAATEAEWIDFGSEILRWAARDLRLTRGSEVAFTLGDRRDAESIRLEWQGELVEGWRFYLPAFITWYGVREDTPDFEVASLLGGTAHTEPGVPYTGTVVFKLKTAKTPTEAVIRLTHNGFPLAINNQVITFNPGESKSFQFNFTGQATDSNLRAEIWPTQPAASSERERDANPDDNTEERTIPRRAAAKPAGVHCCSDGPPPMGINEPAPVSDSSTRYIFSHTTYEVEYIALCVNINSPEVIRGDNTDGRFQFVSYQRDHYNIEVYTMISPGSPGSPPDPRTGRGGSPGSPPVFAWLPAGSMSHRFTIDMPFTITASVGNTVINPASGQRREGRHSLTWRTTNTTSTVVNNFTLTVTAPNGQTWTATDSCTVFLPRGLDVSEPFILDPNGKVYPDNRQIAFVRISNTRDVGEERVTLTYTANGQTVRTETFILPSGPTGADKVFMRAFEFTPARRDRNITLSVTARAEALPGGRVPEHNRTPAASASKTFTVERPSEPDDIPSLERRDITSQTIDMYYRHTTAAQNREYVNSVMPIVRYNTYTWNTRVERYSESLDVSVVIDSWQGRPEGHAQRGRGVWEIQPIFGEDAHRTVRAGQGFELQVQTDYSTNFGSRPPNSRVATSVNSTSFTNFSMRLGVTPQNVTRTWGAFPQANLIMSIDPYDNVNFTRGFTGLRHAVPDPKGWGRDGVRDLEYTQGRAGDNAIRWEYPVVSMTNLAGRTWSARKHMIDKFYPDAYILDGREHGSWGNVYGFYVVTEVAGVTNLMKVHEDHVNIYGSMFDDVYQKRPFPLIRR